MKPNNEVFSIHEFVQSHTEREIKESQCFRPARMNGICKWYLKESVKKQLAAIGFLPFGENNKMKWRIEVWDEIEKLMAERRNARGAEDDTGIPITDAEATNSLLASILQELKKLNEKWN